MITLHTHTCMSMQWPKERAVDECGQGLIW
jgi:hypothetical protein